MRGLQPKCIAVKDNHNFMPVHNPEEVAERVKTYIDLEYSKEQMDFVRQEYTKEATPSSKREAWEGKKSE